MVILDSLDARLTEMVTTAVDKKGFTENAETYGTLGLHFGGEGLNKLALIATFKTSRRRASHGSRRQIVHVIFRVIRQVVWLKLQSVVISQIKVIFIVKAGRRRPVSDVDVPSSERW